MSIVSVVQALRSGHGVSRAIDVLRNFDHPLHEREKEKLLEFTKEYNDKVDAGTARKDLVIPDDVEQLLRRPTAAIPASNVVMCVIGATKIQSLQSSIHRTLQKVVLPIAAPKVAAAEWNAAVSALIHLTSASNPSIATLRCAEEVLFGSVKAVSSDSHEQLVSHWFKLCLVLVEKYARLHAKSSKHGKESTMLSYPKGHEVFLTSVRMVRLTRLFKSSPKILEKAKAMLASSSSDAFSLAMLVHRADGSDVSKNVICSAIKSQPGLVSEILGHTLRIPAGTMTVTEGDDLILHCLYHIGLTTATDQSARDFVAVLQALPARQLQAYINAHLEDVLGQTLNPFLNNPKVFSVGFARVLGECFARMFVAADCAVSAVKPLSTQVVQAMNSRCRSGDEKAAVLIILEAMCRAAQACPDAPSPLLVPSEVSSLVRTELDSSATAAARIAWKLLETLSTEGLSSQIQSALKGAINKEDLRREILRHLTPKCPEAVVLTKPLLQECGEIEMYRVDAFFALPFGVQTSPNLVSSACKTVLTADVLKSISDPEDLRRAADVSLMIASAGLYDAAALLMTHPSGAVRRTIKSFIDSQATQHSSIISFWDAVVRSVFGLESSTKPAILAGTGSHVLLALAPHLLRHSAKLVVHSALVEVLLCCGHDNVVGHDPLFFVADRFTTGQYRSSSASFSRRVFNEIFSNQRQLLQLHADSICTELCAKLSGPAHVASAAARALSLFLHLAPQASTVTVFATLTNLVEKSAAYFAGLAPLDAAIASGSPRAMLEYQKAALTQRGLLKEYTPKPPKGMNEEDYEDMKRKDAVALKAGQETLNKEIEKRSRAIETSVQSNLGPFIALRVIGATGGCKYWEGIPIVYPALLKLLATEPRLEVVYNGALDAAVNLLAATALGPLASQLAAIPSRLSKATSLQTFDVNSIAAVAHHLRQANISHLPAPLFSVLIPFCSAAFKGAQGKNVKTIAASTQHQLLSLLNANAGLDHLPMRKEGLNLYFMILNNFAGLYKTVLHGVAALVAKITPSDVEPMYTALMNGADIAKECAANAFVKFEHFSVVRTALVVAAVMQQSESLAINQSMSLILKNNAFALAESDWDDLLWLLRAYGNRAGNIARISKVMDQLLTIAPSSQSYGVPKIIAIGGMPAVRMIELLAKHYTPASTLLGLEFLSAQAESSDTASDLMEAILAAGKSLLQLCTIETLNQITPQLQARLKRPPTSSNAEHKEKYHAIAVVWLTVMGCRANDTAFLESIIEQQAGVLNSSSSADVHYFVCDCMAEIAANKSVKNSPKLIAFAENCLKTTLTTGSYTKKKAHACGLAGVVQGLGLLSLRKLKVMDAIQAAAKEKQAQRSGAMIVIEMLCEVLGSIFEPYALSMTPLLLEAVAEKDSKISDCADDAAKAMMRNLSDIGLRQLIPRLVEGLLSDQTKKRTPSLGFIGYVAFCSPRQLAATLPSIMKHICTCLFDANSSVSNAAFTALKRVAGVVSNPEIQEHVDLVLNAMRSPSTDTEAALDALLYTRFVNVVDPASLALIVPVIQRGLGEQMRTKAKAAQITASMVHLVSDKKSLMPYTEELLILLQNAAQDPMNDVRTTSAKAVSALAAVMDENFLQMVTDWVFLTLRRSNTSAEKAGAAQTLAEVIAACGEHVLAAHFDTIAKGMQDESPNVREGFLHLMVYAPSTLPQSIFQDFLPVSFPWVLRGLSDFHEKVRTIALTAGSGIIGLYGTRNLSLVLNPLLEGVISETSNLRHSSMLLASKLLIHLVNQIKKKLRIETAMAEPTEEGAPEAEPEDAEDTSLAQAGEIRVETARDAEKRGVSILGTLEEQIGHENFIRILAAMHIGRSEHNLNVRTDCTTAWQVCVASPRAAMTKIFAAIVTMLVKFASSDVAECVDVAEQSIEYTCARLNENVERFVDRFADQYKEGTRRHKVGSLTCLASVVQFADAPRLMKMGGQIVSCVLPGMQEEDTQIRESAGLLFERVTKIVGSRLIESVVESQLETSVRGVLEVVKVRPSVALAVIFKNLGLRSQYTEHDLELIESILELEQAEEDLPKFLERICDFLLACVQQNLEGACDVMTLYAEILPDESAHLPLAQFIKGMKHPETKLATLRAAGAYGMGISVDLVECIDAVLRIVISSLGDDVVEVRETASKLLIELMASIEKRVIANLPEEEQEDVTTARRIAGRFMLQFLDVFQTTLAATARSYITTDEPEFPVLANTKLFDAFTGYYGKVLEWGTDGQRVQAVECLQDVFSFAPRQVAANAAAVTVGRCTKILFVRTPGLVVHALTQVCIQLMKYPSGGKERMVEGNLALAMFNAVLCDSSAARATALKIVAYLVQKLPAQGEVMLGTVATKRAISDTAPLKAIMCRFISFVMRKAKIEKALSQVEKILPIVRPLWESPENAQLAAAAGSAMGALCMSATVTDEAVEEIANKALSMAGLRGAQALGGFSAIYSLLTSVYKRLPQNFASRAVDVIRAAAPLVASDKLSSLWIMRCGSRLLDIPSVAKNVNPEWFYPMLRRVEEEDEFGSSTAKFLCDSIKEVYPEAPLEAYNQVQSTQWLEHGCFDADLDDEVAAEVFF